MEFAAGLAGGCAGVAVGHPFDTVKVKLQTQDYKNPKYSGTWDCFSQTAKKDGLRGLYRGMASPMMGVGAINAVIFGVQAKTSRMFTDQDSLKTHFASGVCAGLAQAFICSPVELTKTRLQIQADMGGPAKYKGPLHCFQEIYKTEGMRGVFRGQLITIMREIPAFGTYFASFEMCARAFSGEETSESAGKLAVFMAGGMAGTASWLVSYPIDVIKSRLQSDGAFGPSKYSGMLDCLRTSIKEEGFGVLTRGLNSTILRAFPTNAATFVVVSSVMKFLKQHEDEVEESCNQVKEILKTGETILTRGDISHQMNRLQDTAMKTFKQSQVANLLPMALESSTEALSSLMNNVNPLLLCQGEGMDADTHTALSAMLKAPIHKAALQRQSRMWMERRGVVTDTKTYSKSALMPEKIFTTGV